ncbi:hypothetical protein ACFSUJ_28530 [Streptomyces lusitanus]|uniref:S1 motif domain-containing protein n=1 Tax=Streptomyces lusitanus TaxID=68232 RepID=A0ABU3JQF3_9ACTN|nr:hypothetical protein [Streptomyces lusitanus]
MMRRLRFLVPGEGTWCWYELDGDAVARRQAVFDRSLPVPDPDDPWGGTAESMEGGVSVAADREGLSAVREHFGPVGAQMYESVYGPLTDGRVRVPGNAEDVSEAEFERAWDAARRQRHFTRHRGGPLPEGTSVTGTVVALPWGPGRTGLAVDIGMPGRGFVDMGHLPVAPEDWPTVGTVTEFEVVQIRIHTSADGADLEVRLRPTATPPPGEPWPRPAPR